MQRFKDTSYVVMFGSFRDCVQGQEKPIGQAAFYSEVNPPIIIKYLGGRYRWVGLH